VDLPLPMLPVRPTRSMDVPLGEPGAVKVGAAAA
jgi:hypothetical protein